MDELFNRECDSKTTGAKKLSAAEQQELLPQLHKDWAISDDKLARMFSFEDFVSALAFTNWVGELAEGQQHHPDIALSWGKVDLVIWTHSAGGLTESDFIWAAKADQLVG